jgi:plastocyanin domain-containing protein
MSSRSGILGNLISIGALLSMLLAAAGSAPAMLPAQITSFHRIEQPLDLKLAVTAIGITLIGLQLWWFDFWRTFK